MLGFRYNCFGSFVLSVPSAGINKIKNESDTELYRILVYIVLVQSYVNYKISWVLIAYQVSQYVVTYHYHHICSSYASGVQKSNDPSISDRSIS